MKTTARIETVDWGQPPARSELAAIRRRVFIEEQRVPEALEWDGLDEAALQLLARVEGQAVATVRMLGDGHIGRMAVLPEFRGRGIGRALLAAVLDAARGAGLAAVDLDAQTHALGFYERLGFVAEGAVFMDAGIPHRHMRLDLAPVAPSP